jgi:hypothetical protein
MADHEAAAMLVIYERVLQVYETVRMEIIKRRLT